MYPEGENPFKFSAFQQMYFNPITLIKEGINRSFDITLKDAPAWEAAYQDIMGQEKFVKNIAKQFFATRG